MWDEGAARGRLDAIGAAGVLDVLGDALALEMTPLSLSSLYEASAAWESGSVLAAVPDLAGLESMRWQLVERDVRCALGGEVSAWLGASCVARRVQRALALRDNLVNLKKVYLHYLKDVGAALSDLHRLATVYFGEGKEECAELVFRGVRYRDAKAQLCSTRPGSVVYVECSRLLQYGRGVQAAVHLCREQTKRVCCVPRHPLQACSASTRGVPGTFELYRSLEEFGRKYAVDFGSRDAQSWCALCGGPGEGAAEPCGDAAALRDLLDLVRQLQSSEQQPGVSEPPNEPSAVSLHGSQLDAPAAPQHDAPAAPRHDARAVPAAPADPAALAAPRMNTPPNDAPAAPQLDNVAAAPTAPSAPSLDEGSLVFVVKVLIARGAAKALRIERETCRLRAALLRCVAAVEALGGLARRRFDADEFAHFRLVQPTLWLEGCAPVLRELCDWLARVLADPQRHWFDAGNWSGSGTGLVLPAGFGAASRALDVLRSAAREHRPALLSALHDEQRYGHYFRGSHACARCGARYAKAFVSALNHLCFRCDEAVREQARAQQQALWSQQEPASGVAQEHQVLRLECPIKLRCRVIDGSRAAFKCMCAHALQCFVCDAWSCELCEVATCDAQEALQSARDERTDVLLLDFDRTLCSTRSGVSPLSGGGSSRRDRDASTKQEHRLCPHLAQAAREHGNVHVVTRNAHVDDIRVFLDQHGLQHVRVHNLKRAGKTSKAQVIKGLLEAGQHALFVDDSPQEALANDLVELQREVRLLGGALRIVLLRATATR